MMNNQLKLYFKPTVQGAGTRYFQKGVVSFSQPSDTEIVAYIKSSTGFKVILKSKSLADDKIMASCTCAAAKKNQLCQHVWAVLFAIAEKSVDFLENKTQIELQAMQTESQNTFKEKQKAFQKQQYEKHKLRQKERNKELREKIKKNKKNTSTDPTFPADVELALQFFSLNGFSLRESLSKETIRFAKVKLARIFHPDLGGSHDEILELNRCADILTQYSKLK